MLKSLQHREAWRVIILMPILGALATWCGSSSRSRHAAVLRGRSRTIWETALRAAPPHAIELALQNIRLADESDPADSVVWGPAAHLAASPRALVRLLGMTSGGWPRTRHGRRHLAGPYCPGEGARSRSGIGGRLALLFSDCRQRAAGSLSCRVAAATLKEAVSDEVRCSRRVRNSAWRAPAIPATCLQRSRSSDGAAGGSGGTRTSQVGDPVLAELACQRRAYRPRRAVRASIRQSRARWDARNRQRRCSCFFAAPWLCLEIRARLVGADRTGTAAYDQRPKRSGSWSMSCCGGPSMRSNPRQALRRARQVEAA